MEFNEWVNACGGIIASGVPPRHSTSLAFPFKICI
jgi:hypothetical protein